MKTTKKFLTVLTVFILLACNAMANIYTVTVTADSGPGSLRQAILDANSNPGVDIIQFSIAASGNLFEGSESATYAVIEISTPLPLITEAVLIDGTTQTNTNTDSIARQLVGISEITLKQIQFPDIYLVPAEDYVFPTNSTGINGNGISIDAANVTIRGLAISGFGNTHTNGGIASGHADIAVLRSPTARTINVTISDCFISCDPTGAFPALSNRRTKGNAILVNGNNETGVISDNYIAYAGTYGIHFNGNTDNNSVGPASTTVGNRNWLVSGNYLMDITTNPTISALTRVNDAITLMKCVAFEVSNNYIFNAEQVGIDIGYNSDSNYISNNTITGFIKTNAFQLQAGIRVGLSSESDTLVNNLIYNNTASTFKAGIWLDRSTLTQAGIITKDNINHVIQENRICFNTGNAITLSTTGSGLCYNNKITRNSTYNNTGLGIDLNFIGTTGTPGVTVNDDGDVDAGLNNLQNYPLLDSVKKISATQVIFYGKAPAGSTIEFFINDGQLNNHGGKALNYGEGKTFLGSGVEGSVDDAAIGTSSYNVDGNIETSSQLFAITVTHDEAIGSLDSVTSTATLGNNTSEFGPVSTIQHPLAVELFSFSSNLANKVVTLNWKASCDEDFKYFLVEHGRDGKTFSSIGAVFPIGVESIYNYEFRHTGIYEGNHFYRLKMINETGKIKYSKIIYVNARSSNERLQLNTVFNSKIDIQFKSDANGEAALQLFNANGALVKNTQVTISQGTNFTSLDQLENLSPGMYIVVVRTSQNIYTKKIMKQ